MDKRFNRYDVLLLVLLGSLAAGDLGGALQPVRILIFCLAPFWLRDWFGSHQAFKKQYLYERITFGVWFVYALLSLVVAYSVPDSLKQIVYFGVHFIGVMEMLWLSSKAQNPQRAILLGWLLVFVLTLPIAIWEITTDQHLAYSFNQSASLELGGKTRVTRHFASVYFGNLNTYNVMLCYALIATVGCLLSEKKGLVITGGIGFVGVAVMILLNSSRMATITLALVLFLLLFSYRKRPKIFLPLLVLLAGSLVFLLIQYKDLFFLIFSRFAQQGFEDSNRLRLITCGLQELMDSYGLGVGVGNFIPIMENKYRLAISAPHNLWLEIITQYGVLVFALFVGLMVRILRKSKGGTHFNRWMAWIGVVALLPISVINSGYLLYASFWLYIASLYVLADPTFNYQEPQTAPPLC